MATKGAPQGGYGKRPPNDPVHLVTLCHRHHQDGWATASRYGLRVYLLWQALRDRADTAAAVIDQLREIGNVDNYSDLASDLRALAEERP